MSLLRIPANVSSSETVNLDDVSSECENGKPFDFSAGDIPATHDIHKLLDLKRLEDTLNAISLDREIEDAFLTSDIFDR